MLKSEILSAVRQLPGDRAEKSRICTMIHFEPVAEVIELTKYTDDPRDIAIYLADFQLSAGIIATYSRIRILNILNESNYRDTSNNVGRMCSQPYDSVNRSWYVTGCISLGKYVLFNTLTREFRIADIQTMSNLY